MSRAPLHLLGITLVCLSVCACTASLQGPEIDLATIATPDPVPQPVKPPLPLPGPTPDAGSFRAWVPPVTHANGDRIEGHWHTISLTPPPAEVMEPTVPMPRAPKTHVVTKPKPESITAPQPLLSQGTSQAVLPTGLMPQQGQGLPQVGRTPPRALPLGGQ
jgi:hypothetical protein